MHNKHRPKWYSKFSQWCGIQSKLQMSWPSLMISQIFTRVVGRMLDSPKICPENRRLKCCLLNQVPFTITYVGFSFFIHFVLFEKILFWVWNTLSLVLFCTLKFFKSLSRLWGVTKFHTTDKVWITKNVWRHYLHLSLEMHWLLLRVKSVWGIIHISVFWLLQHSQDYFQGNTCFEAHCYFGWWSKYSYKKNIHRITESQNSRSWKGPLWVF